MSSPRQVELWRASSRSIVLGCLETWCSRGAFPLGAGGTTRRHRLQDCTYRVLIFDQPERGMFDPKDMQALFARGVAGGLRADFRTIAFVTVATFNETNDLGGARADDGRRFDGRRILRQRQRLRLRDRRGAQRGGAGAGCARVSVIQFDEPVYSRQPDRAVELGIPALDRAAQGLKNAKAAVHVCYGYPHKGSSASARRAIPRSSPRWRNPPSTSCRWNSRSRRWIRRCCASAHRRR